MTFLAAHPAQIKRRRKEPNFSTEHFFIKNLRSLTNLKSLCTFSKRPNVNKM